MSRRAVIVTGLVAASSLALFLFFLLVYKDHGEPAERIELAGTENFYRISGELYRAGQPTAGAMRAYEAYGIKTVINLRTFHSDADEVQGTSLILKEIPVLTWDLETAEVIEVLQAIRDAAKPVLIHCQHGSDRTGLMVAMYRIVEQGWDKEEAIWEMTRGGFGFHDVWAHIPEFIRNMDVNAVKAALH